MTTSKASFARTQGATTAARKSRRAPKQKQLNLDWNKTYNTKQVCKIFSVTPRNLQYWSEQKILNPKLEDKKTAGGTIRRFGMRDLILVGVMVALKKKGINLRKLRRVVEQITLHIGIHLLTPLGIRGGNGRMYIPALADCWIKVRYRSTGPNPLPKLWVPLRDILNRIERGRP